jgi:hypothetical protein
MHASLWLLAGDPAFVERALGGDLWASSAPGLVGVLGVAVLVAAGVGAALWLLRDGAPAGPPRPTSGPVTGDPLAAELEAFACARRRLVDELAAHPDRAAGSALASLLTGPLDDLDRRVARLQRTLGSCRGDALAGEALRVETEERRLRGLLAAEDDPGARALLEASLRDVAESARMHQGLVRRGRLAQLEVGRLRALLEALPARLREVAAAQALAPGDTTDAEDIARQLELAVQSTSDVLEDVERV